MIIVSFEWLSIIVLHEVICEIVSFVWRT